MQPSRLALLVALLASVALVAVAFGQLPGPCEKCRGGFSAWINADYCIPVLPDDTGTDNCKITTYAFPEYMSFCEELGTFCAEVTVTPDPDGGGGGTGGGGGGSGGTSPCYTSNFCPVTCFSCTPTPPLT